MTKKEQNIKKRVKKELQEKGVIPPDKKRLNRKAFFEEASEAFEELGFADFNYIVSNLKVMMDYKANINGYSLENIGACKVVLLAKRDKEFFEKLKKEGKETYKISEQYEYIKDILDA